MNTRRCALAVSAALLNAVPVPSQAQVDNQPDKDAADISLALSDGIRNDIVGDPDGDGDGIDDTAGGSSAGGSTLTGGPGDGSGADENTGVLDFTVCDSRTDEIGWQVSITHAGSVIVRNFQCD